MGPLNEVIKLAAVPVHFGHLAGGVRYGRQLNARHAAVIALKRNSPRVDVRQARPVVVLGAHVALLIFCARPTRSITINVVFVLLGRQLTLQRHRVIRPPCPRRPLISSFF
jgi:hypothetical protein